MNLSLRKLFFKLNFYLWNKFQDTKKFNLKSLMRTKINHITPLNIRFYDQSLTNTIL
jgi:hypothetical protein